MDYDSLPVSARELAIEALAAVLREIPVFRRISRQGLTYDRVSDKELPAVIISEGQSVYRAHQTNPYRIWRTTVPLVLDLQARAYRPRGCAEAARSTARELLVHVVMRTLAENPLLVVQLDGEDEPCAHATIPPDREVRVTYIEEDDPFVRAVIEFELLVEEQMDARARTEGRTIELELITGGPPLEDEE